MPRELRPFGLSGGSPRDALRASRHRWTLGQLVALLAMLAALLATFGWLLGPFDLQVFLDAARQVARGASPYGSTHAAAFRSGHDFVYPYLVAWAFVPLGALPPSIAVAFYLVLSVVGIAAACHLLGRPGFFPTALVLVCSTTIVGLQMGTVNALLLLGLAVAWAWRSKPAVAGMAVGLVAVTKLFLLPTIGWLILSRRYRAAAIATTVSVSILSVGWAVGPLGFRGYFHVLSALEANEAHRSWSLASLLESLGAAPGLAHGLAMGAAAAVLLLGAAIGIAGWGDERAVFSAAIVASLFLSPIVWSSYLLLLLAPLLVVALDDVSIGVAAVASWFLVTPDAASLPRAAVGFALALGVAVVAVRSQVLSGSGFSGRRRLIPSRRLSTPTRTGLAIAALGCVMLLVVVPPEVRNALPAVMCACTVLGQVMITLRRAGPTDGLWYRAQGAAPPL